MQDINFLKQLKFSLLILYIAWYCPLLYSYIWKENSAGFLKTCAVKIGITIFKYPGSVRSWLGLE
jgi:hypothetical protein